ncbi:hypothetical protein HMPREF9123_1246 [Neisseria bacilliformis ATCC BAA-1200]|uniref:Uncharacterized protein n=1 Tax=Neisseria bacilliformis ATCC BAA-1200 TaxID=888742 RepID=F2BBZ1_9NEIS|nr:hypothetical protein HMPREF9123_1246 [Neisseria bacilliformis ATCC BAA-1200]
MGIAAVFLVKIHACRVKNARKVSNHAVFFFLAYADFSSKNRFANQMQTALAARSAKRIMPPFYVSVCRTIRQSAQTAALLAKPRRPAILRAPNRNPKKETP